MIPKVSASPSAQALTDFTQGLNEGDNPYPKGTTEHRIYAEAMNIYLGAEDEREKSKNTLKSV